MQSEIQAEGQAERVSMTQARDRFREIVNRVELMGAQFTLERNGKPVARIVPIGKETAQEK